MSRIRDFNMIDDVAHAGNVATAFVTRTMAELGVDLRSYRRDPLPCFHFKPAESADAPRFEKFANSVFNLVI